MNVKKIAIAALIMLISQNVFAQNKSFTLTGKLANVKDGSKIYIYYYKSEVKRDSVILQNGIFEFRGNLTNPITAQLLLLHEPIPTGKKLLLPIRGALDFLNLYIDEGVIKLNGADSVKNLIISNSQINEEDQQLSQIVNVFEKKIRTIRAAFAQAPAEKKKDLAFVNASNDKWAAVTKDIQFTKFQFAKDHPNSYVSLNALNDLALHRTFDYNLLQTAYQTLSDRYKNTPLAIETKQLIIAGVNATVGSLAHDFTQPDVNGKLYKVSDFKGKYLLLEFWTSWAEPCRKENPNLVRAYETYKDKNFTIMAISLDKKREAWLKAIDEDKLPYLQVNDLKGPGINDGAAVYGIQTVPANFLIDPSGKIIAKNLRGEALNKKLVELFQSK